MSRGPRELERLFTLPRASRRRPGRMTLTNTTDIPDEKIREMIRFVRPPGIGKFTVEVRDARYAWGGQAYWPGDRVVCKVGPASRFPCCMRTRFKQTPDLWLASREEALVMLLAHELRHLWQFKRKRSKRRAGYYPRTRGYLSEVDCDCYAIAKVRQWRREH